MTRMQGAASRACRASAVHRLAGLGAASPRSDAGACTCQRPLTDVFFCSEAYTLSVSAGLEPLRLLLLR